MRSPLRAASPTSPKTTSVGKTEEGKIYDEDEKDFYSGFVDTLRSLPVVCGIAVCIG